MLVSGDPVLAPVNRTRALPAEGQGTPIERRPLTHFVNPERACGSLGFFATTFNVRYRSLAKAKQKQNERTVEIEQNARTE
jgi:hypothetical protein